MTGCHVLRSTWRPKPEKYDENRQFPIKRTKTRFKVSYQRNSNRHPIFSTTPDTHLMMPTLPDICRLRKFKMADCEPEVEITLERKEIATRFQRLPHIFDHTRHACSNTDTARHLPTTEIQNGGRQTGNRNNFGTERDSDAIPAANPHFRPRSTRPTCSWPCRYCQTSADYKIENGGL